MTRWHALVTYRSDGGGVDVPHDVEELQDLQALIELGPNWATIERIVVTYAGPLAPLTLEGAEAAAGHGREPPEELAHG